jgi:putative transposase
VLTSEVRERLKDLLYEKAEAINVIIEALEIMPDHVHLFVSADPTEAPQSLDAMCQIPYNNTYM